MNRSYCLVVLSLLAILAGLRADAAPPQKVVARVGSVEITQHALAFQMRRLRPQVSFHGRLTAKMKGKLRKLALQRLIEEALFFNEAERRRLVPDDATIKRTRAMQIKRSGGPQKFAQRLARLGLSWPQHWQLMRRRIAVEKLLLQLVVRPSRPDDKALEAYYTANTSKFKRPPQAKLEQLLFPVAPGSADAVWQQAAKEAAQAAKGLRTSGSFRKLAVSLAHSSKGRIKAKELGWIHRMRLAKDLDAAAFKLQNKQVSAPIKTMRGYVVLRCLGRRAPKQLTFEQVKAKLRTEIFKKHGERRRSELLAKLRKTTKVALVR